MAPTNALTLALFALASSAAAQSTITSAATTAAASGSVVAFTFPGGLDPGTYLGSVIGSANSLTTVLVGCPEGSNTSACDFYPAVPITANSNTIMATWTYGTTFTYTYACTMSSAGATCVAQATGIAADFVTQTTGTDSLTQITSSSLTETYNATDIITAPITLITGNASGQIAGVGPLATTTASNGTAVLSSSSHSSSSHSASSGSSSVTTFHPSSSSTSTRASTAASSSGTSSAGAADVKILAPGVFAAGLVGLAAVLL